MDKYKKKLIEIKRLKADADSTLIKLEDKLTQLNKDLETYLTARYVLTNVIELTQSKFKKDVESLITLLIATIFDKNYKFSLEFEEKNNQLECYPVIHDGDIVYSVSDDDLGGSVLDVISFALRVVLWTLETPQSRPIFILDEPMKWLGNGDELEKACRLLYELSHELKIQILLVTHEPQFIEIADRAFIATLKNKVTTLKMIDRSKK